jgi:signal recognition particle GTPase
MVLGELGSKISASVRKVLGARQIDQSLLDEMLTDLTRALLAADVDIALTKRFRDAVKKQTELSKLAAGLNQRKVIEKVCCVLCSV